MRINHGLLFGSDVAAILSVMSGDYSNNSDVFTNGTDNDPLDPEAAGTHIDDPNGTYYMLGGVFIAMLLVGVIIILLAVTISKLRKREDNLHTSSPAVTTNHNNNLVQQQSEVPVVVCSRDVVSESLETLPPPFLWTNSTTASSQCTLYNNDEDNLVRDLACEEPRECKGFRKNLSGKWRRLVKKKQQQQEVYTIPAELKDQLKTIYVY